jgi:hypothetical protein
VPGGTAAAFAPFGNTAPGDAACLMRGLWLGAGRIAIGF